MQQVLKKVTLYESMNQCTFSDDLKIHAIIQSSGTIIFPKSKK